MYIMCVCLFSVLSRKAGALQISIIIISSSISIIRMNEPGTVMTRRWLESSDSATLLQGITDFRSGPLRRDTEEA